MNEFFSFFADNSWARWLVVFLFTLLVAFRPTLRAIRLRMEKKAAEHEVSIFEILRKEIQTLSMLLVKEQGEKRPLYDEIDRLQRENAELRSAINAMKSNKK